MSNGNYIAPGENRPCVLILYVECTLSAWPLPAGDWKKSLDGAFGFAVDAAAKRFNLRKEDLEVKISDPSYKNSRLKPEAWARQNYTRVVPKPHQGLEGENTRLKALNSKLILQVTKQKEEIENKLMKVNKEQAEKIQELQKDSRESLKEENTKLMERVAKLAEETSKLKEELTDLSRQLSAQGRQLSALEQRLSALRMVERVLLQKLCEAAREKCVRLAREADVEIPLAADGKTNWNAFYNIPESIPRRLHAGAHQVVESEEVFLDTVLELTLNEFRTKMENILILQRIFVPSNFLPSIAILSSSRVSAVLNIGRYDPPWLSRFFFCWGPSTPTIFFVFSDLESLSGGVEGSCKRPNPIAILPTCSFFHLTPGYIREQCRRAHRMARHFYGISAIGPATQMRHDGILGLLVSGHELSASSNII
ncbi:hypothetical protein SELMODRAFT_420928 [Selaginella moellendorffii]|uniref:Uncharacterized protein n=1 Tax=Selaginella moellendorffii TaxID=88036 RepID=D8SDK4_SELML|nr:hypothetical protein SELMODRAFT_420928 [Selaginella moellendorffii]